VGAIPDEIESAPRHGDDIKPAALASPGGRYTAGRGTNLARIRLDGNIILQLQLPDAEGEALATVASTLTSSGRDIGGAGERRAAVTYEKRHVALYDGFEGVVVIHAAIGQQHARSKRGRVDNLEMAECWLRLAINADDCPQLAKPRVPATKAAARNGSTNVLEQWITPQTGSLIEKSCS
jgi:hypothetical protein